MGVRQNYATLAQILLKLKKSLSRGQVKNPGKISSGNVDANNRIAVFPREIGLATGVIEKYK